jgi:hypothetical protein
MLGGEEIDMAMVKSMSGIELLVEAPLRITIFGRLTEGVAIFLYTDRDLSHRSIGRREDRRTIRILVQVGEMVLTMPPP